MAKTNESISNAKGALKNYSVPVATVIFGAMLGAVIANSKEQNLLVGALIGATSAGVIYFGVKEFRRPAPNV